MALEVFREMTVHGSQEQLAAFIEGVERRLTHGWTRDREAERNPYAPETWYVFACEVDHSIPRDAASLYLLLKGEENADAALHVTNIVPKSHIGLGRRGYNRILEEFHGRFAEPSAEETGVTVRVTSDEYRVQDHVSAEAFDLLRAFSSAANRFGLHPVDLQRWRRALLALHEEEWPVGRADLERWLVEEQQWPDDLAAELSAQVLFAQDLLHDYDLALES